MQPLCGSQVVITASQIQWTADVTKCLLTAKERGDKKILKVLKKKQVGGPPSVRQAWGASEGHAGVWVRATAMVFCGGSPVRQIWGVWKGWGSGVAGGWDGPRAGSWVRRC